MTARKRWQAPTSDKWKHNSIPIQICQFNFDRFLQPNHTNLNKVQLKFIWGLIEFSSSSEIEPIFMRTFCSYSNVVKQTNTRQIWWWTWQQMKRQKVQKDKINMKMGPNQRRRRKRHPERGDWHKTKENRTNTRQFLWWNWHIKLQLIQYNQKGKTRCKTKCASSHKRQSLMWRGFSNWSRLTLIVWGHEHVDLEALRQKMRRRGKKGKRPWQGLSMRALEVSAHGLLLPSMSSKLIALPSTWLWRLWWMPEI